MFRTRVATVALVIVTLSGCSAGDTEAPRTAAEPTAESAPSSTPAPAPATVTPTPEASAQPESGRIADADAVFLNYARGLTFGLEAMSDDELISAGLFACEGLDAGGDWTTIHAIVGTTPTEPTEGANNANVIGVARETLCVEHRPETSILF